MADLCTRLGMNVVKDRLRDALSERARHVSISLGAWEQTIARAQRAEGVSVAQGRNPRCRRRDKRDRRPA